MENQNKLTTSGAADVIEGGEKVKGNKAYAEAKKQLQETFNPESPRQLDQVAMHFNEVHFFAPVLDHKNKWDGSRVKILFPAGMYLSNVELDLKKTIERDYPDVQGIGLNLVTEAGYMTKAEEPEVEAKILNPV